MTDDTNGVDISAAHFDACRLPNGNRRRFDNTARGFRAFRRWLGPALPARVVYEPSGPYHGAFARALGPDLPLVRVDGWRARRFAESLGQRAKTDPLDAAMLARMGAVFDMVPDRPVHPDACDLRELQGARQALVKQRAGEKMRRATCTLPLLRSQAAARIAQLDRQIDRIDRDIQTRISDDPARRRARDILCSMPGIAPVTAAALLIHMPELGQRRGKEAAALAGLAPITRKSGTWEGKARIRGGRALLREALYMPALSAIRHNPDLKAFYARLRGKGKPGKLALTAVMRKLVELANLLVAKDRPWRPKPA